MKKLLNMYYTPPELAAELDLNSQRLYRAIRKGCPHIRKKDRFFIHGLEFKEWILSLKKEKIRLKADEVYCVTCQGPVKLGRAFTMDRIDNRIECIRGKCPHCGNGVSKVRSIRVATS